MSHFELILIGIGSCIVFGVVSVSVLVPWLFFVPAMGNGVLARKVLISRLACAWALMMLEISVFFWSWIFHVN